MQKITSAHSQFLFDVAATRRIEHRAASGLPPYTLMQRAGLAVARLTMAIAPHAQCIWVAGGPGKNGMPPDAHAAHARAIAAGVLVADEPPSDFDFCIDALFGIGADLDPEREGSAHILQWLKVMHDSAASCLAVDVLTGLNADTGQSIATKSVAACARIHWATARFLRFTLPILTLKPGLFTSEGRDSAGEVWFDDLGVDVPNTELPSAKLLGASSLASPQRLHSFHKGSFGDVAILGGESTASSHMAGAALLAASAALHAGAGRVFVAQYSTSGNDGKYTSSRYALVSGAWATASETPPYVLKTSGWELGNNSISGTFTSDGQGGGTAAETGNGRSFRFSARSVDLSGATFGSDNSARKTKLPCGLQGSFLSLRVGLDIDTVPLAQAMHTGLPTGAACAAQAQTDTGLVVEFHQSRVSGFLDGNLLASAGLGGPYNALLRSPAMARRCFDLLDYLRFKTSVDKRLNEFAILIQARIANAQYEWWAHEAIARRAGLSDAVMRELQLCRRPSSMQDDERLVYDYCTQLTLNHRVSDALWQEAVTSMGEQALIDLTVLSGTYVMVSMLLNATQIAIPGGAALPLEVLTPAEIRQGLLA